MKVWEKMREFKESNASRNVIRGWCLSNRITPDLVTDVLDMVGKDAETIEIIAYETEQEDAYQWLDNFLDSEFI